MPSEGLSGRTRGCILHPAPRCACHLRCNSWIGLCHFKTLSHAAILVIDVYDCVIVCLLRLQKGRLDEVMRTEATLLEARSAPLRKYLMDNVIPSLTQGLLEVAKAKPKDPVDFLVCISSLRHRTRRKGLRAPPPPELLLFS